MSISTLGLGSMLDPIGALNASKTAKAAASATDKAAAAAAASKANTQAVLDQIRQKGIYAWAQEQKMEAMKAKIRAQVLDEKKMTEADITNMPPDAQASIKATLEEEIARRVKEAMQAELKSQLQDKADDHKATGPMIIDISV